MNPIQEIKNEYVKEIKFNMQVILDAIELGPPSQMIRAPSHNASEEEEVHLIPDDSFPNTPDNFVMPQPCEQCCAFCCNGMCSQETVLIPRQLSFEEEMDLPHPPALTRINTTAPLRDEEWNLCLPPLTRINTNELLVALSEAESNMRDEYEATFFKELEDKKQEDQDK
jgi:hypothetical protein